MRWAGHIAARIEGEMRNTYKMLIGRRGRRWEDNVRMNLREVEWEGVDWIYLAVVSPLEDCCEHIMIVRVP
jgi:hypothetical protein